MRAPLLIVAPEHPGHRARQDEGAGDSRFIWHEPAETRFRHRSAKSGDFRRVEVLSTVSELRREDCSSRANPAPSHAARHFRERALQQDVAPS